MKMNETTLFKHDSMLLQLLRQINDKTNLAHFLSVNVTFSDAVNMIHDVITIANPFPYNAKFMFVGVRNSKTQQVRC